MRFTRALRSLAVLLSFGFLGFAPGALAELLDDPIELGFVDTPGSAQGVSVVGTLAYVADATGLRVIDSIVRIPEPGALLLGLTALGTLGVLRRERERRLEQFE